MKVLAKVKMPKISQRDFLVAHRYTICDGMCALRGVLQTAVACRRQSKGNTAFSLRCRGRTYPFAYFAFSEAPEQNNKADALPPERIRFLLYQDSCGFFPKSATPLSTMTPPSRARPAPACPKASPTAPTRGLAGIISRL